MPVAFFADEAGAVPSDSGHRITDGHRPRYSSQITRTAGTGTMKWPPCARYAWFFLTIGSA